MCVCVCVCVCVLKTILARCVEYILVTMKTLLLASFWRFLVEEATHIFCVCDFRSLPSFHWFPHRKRQRKWNHVRTKDCGLQGSVRKPREHLNCLWENVGPQRPPVSRAGDVTSSGQRKPASCSQGSCWAIAYRLLHIAGNRNARVKQYLCLLSKTSERARAPRPGFCLSE